MHTQKNGDSEKAAQTAKNIRKNKKIQLGVLSYKSAPQSNGATPSEILMGRKLRIKLEIINNHELIKEENYIKSHKNNHMSCYKTFPILQKGDRVYIQDQHKYGEVTNRTNNPRSYQK